MDLDLNKIKSMTWATVVFIVVTIIISGVLFIFSFNRELFFKTELVKLILLSISITAPIWLLNTVLVLLFVKPIIPNDEDLQGCVITGCIISIVVIYLPILVKFFFNITTHTGVIILLILQFCFSIIGFVSYYIESRSPKTRK